MLRATFIHANGIGPATERRIWDAGVHDWESFLDRREDVGLSGRQCALLVPVIHESVDRFDAGNYRYFARRLASREHWRAFGELGNRAAFLDIETTGMHLDAAVTVIGVYDGVETKTFVKGFNLEDFADEIESYPLLVTYSGATFDLPHLRRRFAATKLDQLHIDLCPTLRRLGYKGGLKLVEQDLGITRPDHLLGLDGWDAVRLWHEWENGSREALDLLIDYNRADVVNLARLAEFAYRELRRVHLPCGPRESVISTTRQAR